jgi:hypothetical protein
MPFTLEITRELQMYEEFVELAGGGEFMDSAFAPSDFLDVFFGGFDSANRGMR